MTRIKHKYENFINTCILLYEGYARCCARICLWKWSLVKEIQVNVHFMHIKLRRVLFQYQKVLFLIFCK